jgi:putative holliday junction resolvase
MNTEGRIIGVDYGTKRVGLALADPLCISISPIGTFDPSRAVEELRRFNQRDPIGTIVVGWPLLLDGSEGDQTKRVQEYVNRIRNAFPHVDVLKWDERYTSEMARAAVAEYRQQRRGGREPGLDAVAACIILQDYLER